MYATWTIGASKDEHIEETIEVVEAFVAEILGEMFGAERAKLGRHIINPLLIEQSELFQYFDLAHFILSAIFIASTGHISTI